MAVFPLPEASLMVVPLPSWKGQWATIPVGLGADVGGFKVTVAMANFVGSALLVALTVTV